MGSLRASRAGGFGLVVWFWWVEGKVSLGGRCGG